MVSCVVKCIDKRFEGEGIRMRADEGQWEETRSLKMKIERARHVFFLSSFPRVSGDSESHCWNIFSLI